MATYNEDYALIPFDEIEKVEFDEKRYLKTGIKELDKAICGFGLGQLVILTGPRSGGKTTFVGNMICNFVEQGHYGLLFSFELANYHIREWLIMHALGKDNLVVRNTTTGTPKSYAKDSNVEKAAAGWLGRRLSVFNNAGFDKAAVMELIKRHLKENPQIKFIVLDNLMKIDFTGSNADNKYTKQSEFVKELQVFAQKHKVCLVLVVHPNKTKTIPRIEDVGGSGDIINTADTVIFVHKVSMDFKKRVVDDLQWRRDDPALNYDNLFEVVKNREFGTENDFIGVYFEPTAKRFLNKKDENTQYSFTAPNYQTRILPTLTEIKDDDEQIPF